MQPRTLTITAALAGAALLGGCDALAGLLSGRLIQSTPPPPPASPLPTGSPSGPATRAEILGQFQRSEHLPLFTSRLINDGIGIFAGADPASPSGARRWGRDYKAEDVPLDDQTSVFLSQGRVPRALLVFKRQESGTWLGDYPWRKSLVRKGFRDSFHREALLEEVDGKWRLAGLSVAIERAADASVDIAGVKLAVAGTSLFYRTGPEPEERIIPLSSLIAGRPGAVLSIVVHAKSDAAVFAYLGGTTRVALEAAGSDGTGYLFRADVPFPGVQGIGQIGIDAVARSTLADTSAAYDATLWGVPVTNLGGAL